MNKFFILTLFYSLIFSPYLAMSNEAIYLKGSIDEPLTKIHYTLTLEKSLYPGYLASIPVDHEGNFNYKINPGTYPSLTDSSYRIIDDPLLINSFTEAVSLAEGKPVYLDIWATWCVPCIQEFKHKPAVSQLLEEFGYFPIYISIDMEQHEERWKQMIYQYELKEGIHIRANGNLKGEIMKLYGSQNSLTIPIYALLDPQGNIIIKQAARPSDLVRLKMQLSENFNK